MSLVCSIQARLNSNVPLKERCEFAKEICDRSGISFTFKESVVVNWLLQELEKEESRNSADVWSTLHHVLELALSGRKGNASLLLKNSFASDTLQHVERLVRVGSFEECLESEIFMCFSVVLHGASTSQIFLKQPVVLLRILSAFLKIINSYISSGSIPKDLLNSFFSCFKHVLDNEVLTSEKVLDILVSKCLKPWLTFINIASKVYENNYNENLSSCTVKWLKDVLCHPRLIIAYKCFLNLEPPQKAKTNLLRSVQKVMQKTEHLLRSESEKSCGSRLMTIILQGMFEKRSHNFFDLPFSILVHFSKLTTDLKDAQKLDILNQLLEVCTRNPSLFLRNGTVTSVSKISWFKELSGNFTHTLETHEELLKFFTLLLAVNPEIIESQLEAIWSILWLNTSGLQSEAQTHLLCLLLKTYARLRQVPKLFKKLIECLEKASEFPVNIDVFPKTFMIQFSECIASLPAGQTLELWQMLLNVINLLYLNRMWKFPSMVQLCNSLLLHLKLTENHFPTSKQGELRELLFNTMLFLQNILKTNSTPEYNILNLCYSLGEVVLMLKLYRADADSFLSIDFPEMQADSELFDISTLHPYLSSQEWTTCLSNIDLSDEKLTSCVVLLLIQKVRSSTVLSGLNSDDVATISSSVSSSLFSYIYDRLQDETCNADLWDTSLFWFPILLTTFSSKKLTKLCQVVVKSMMREDSKNENCLARSVLKASCTFELRRLQTSLITSLWEEAGSSVCMKRKCDERNSAPLWRQLSRHSQIWQQFSTSVPEENDNKMWQEIKMAAVELKMQCEDNQKIDKSVNVERAVHLVRILCLFPLEDMEPGNQFRCVLGLFQFFTVLISTRSTQKSELFVTICQVLVSLLTKMPTARMSLFFDASVLLPKVFEMMGNSDSADEHKWIKTLLERLVYICMSDPTAKLNLDEFAKQLNKHNGSSALEAEVLQVIVSCYLLALKKHEHSKKVELFQELEPVVDRTIKAISKTLLTSDSLNHDLVCKCINNILTYHCRTIPDHLLVSKRRPKKFLKKHLTTIQSLVASCHSMDASTQHSLYELVGLLCKNRKLFDKELSEDFVLAIWDSILNNISKSSFNETMQNAYCIAVTSLIKCLSQVELSLVINKLNVHYISEGNSGMSKTVHILSLWNIVLSVNFGVEIPREISTGVAQFLGLLLPQLVQPLSKSSKVYDVVLPTLQFMADLLQKVKVPIRHSQIVICFQTCSSLNLSSLETVHAIPLCNVLLTIYRRLLTRALKVILQSVAPFLSCLTTIIKQLVRLGNQKHFNLYNEEQKKSVVLCAQDLSKLLAVMVNHKTEFCKQAGFLIADYIYETQEVTVHPLVKEQILLGVYRILDICDDHMTAMLQVSLPSGGREVLKQILVDFNQHYKYRGKV